MKTFHITPRSSRTNRWRGVLLLILFLVLTATELFASVLVAPTIVILSNKNRTGRMILQNPTDKPKEISIRFAFGIPFSDSLGNVRVQLQDTAVSDPHSAVGWIRAFPRKIILQPGAQQTVRFVARPPKDLPDGEYWARIVVKSQEVHNGPEKPLKEGQITTTLNMIMQTAIALKYRQGVMVSELELLDGKADLVDSQVTVTVDIANRGNMSYLGVMHCRLVDADNKEISTTQTDIAIYYDTRRRFVLPVTSPDFKKPFHVEFHITTDGRNDIAPEDRVRGNDIKFSALIE